MERTVAIKAFALKIGLKIFPVIAKAAIKGAKAGKFVLAGASFASYSYVFTWKFALMMMLFIFVHESGHLWAMKRYGMKIEGIYFLPFIGGIALARGRKNLSPREETVTAIMGPIWGLILALLTGIFSWRTGNQFLAAAASWIALVNLFNLLPINPLDEGRIMKCIAYSVSVRTGILFVVAGMAISAILIIEAHLWLFLIVLVIGGIEFLEDCQYRRIRFLNWDFAIGRRGGPRRFESMSRKAILGSLLVYIGVAGALAVVMFSCNIPVANLALEILKD